MSLVRISRELAKQVDGLQFSAPVSYVYNPLVYAREPHERYLTQWGGGKKRALLLGMNPGPFGMAQTGVPFGDVSLVRDFLGVTGKVGKPALQHAKRPIEGFQCARGEVSGQRLWGFARDRFGSPETFFQNFFVVNYCPLVFMEESGANRTPDKLPKAEQLALFAACDAALVRIVEELQPEHVIGVGAFATGRAKAALPGFSGRIATILHPSPASPKANRGWAALVEKELEDHGLAELLPRKPRK
ncbi:MAG: single-strand selective monofunctional uracil-DNA glycosylase [Myxococcales bacterium]|nr:MAG: single-strand selective monofunctional uracil-DNA glycosylase [Myxococcales bacterium]